MLRRLSTRDFEHRMNCVRAARRCGIPDIEGDLRADRQSLLDEVAALREVRRAASKLRWDEYADLDDPKFAENWAALVAALAASEGTP